MPAQAGRERRLPARPGRRARRPGPAQVPAAPAAVLARVPLPRRQQPAGNHQSRTAQPDRRRLTRHHPKTIMVIYKMDAHPGFGRHRVCDRYVGLTRFAVPGLVWLCVLQPDQKHAGQRHANASPRLRAARLGTQCTTIQVPSELPRLEDDLTAARSRLPRAARSPWRPSLPSGRWSCRRRSAPQARLPAPVRYEASRAALAAIVV